MARAPCEEEQQDPETHLLGTLERQSQKSPGKEETEAQGKRGLVQGHHPASYPADRVGLELPLTEGPPGPG